ncbi:MAG TPA: ribonuclease HII [Bacteroidales bacterium]|nr:ribonuclease HII [Bacteroidales bacterium]
MADLKSCYQTDYMEAGCDEAGRGCLAGPVFAAAVILPVDYFHPLLNDSKQLTEKQRDCLRCEIEREAIAWAVESSDNLFIDKHNILKASIYTMHKALEKLKQRPGFVIIDGNYFLPYGDIPHKTIVKGDALYYSIAAASVLAKTHRDEYMENLHLEFPIYQWNSNKGYPTLAHRKAIAAHGICDYHRKSFNLFDEQLSLSFD